MPSAQPRRAEGELMAGSKPGRPGASKGSKKGPTKGTGGKNKRSLEGRGPTPKAEDRAWHPAGKRKAAAERYAAAGGKGRPRGSVGREPQRRARRRTTTPRWSPAATRCSRRCARRSPRPRSTSRSASRWTTASRRCSRSPRTARSRCMEVTRPELDRMAGFDGVHQGVALKVPPYEYAHPQDLLEQVIDRGRRRCSSRSTASPTRATSAPSSAPPARSAGTA